jgi:hypothetical protein
MNIKIELFTGLFAALLLTGCVKDELFRTSHPTLGAVSVTTDWSGSSSDAVLPDKYILRTENNEQTVTGNTNSINTLFTPSKQMLTVYNLAEGITVNNNIATVGTESDGSLLLEPGFLFAAYTEMKVTADDTVKVTVPMTQYTRTLSLYLHLNKGDELRITSTSATLAGIASAVDITTGKITSGAGNKMHPKFVLSKIETRSDEIASPPVLTTTIRILGINTDEEQLLSIEIGLNDGTEQTLTTNLSNVIRNSGNETMEPLALTSSLTLPAEAGIQATINDWKAVDNGTLNIH